MISGRIQGAVLEIRGFQRAPYEYQSGALHGFGCELGANGAELSAQHAFIRPAGPHDHGHRAIGSVVGDQFFDDCLHGLDGQMNGQSRAACRERRQSLSIGHARGAPRHARQYQTLRDAGCGQFAAENSGRGSESRNTPASAYREWSGVASRRNCSANAL